MAAYEYRFANYSFQYSDQADASHSAITAMTDDGWHVHTCAMNFTEVSILWERGGSASADRVQDHFEEKGVLPKSGGRRKATSEG